MNSWGHAVELTWAEDATYTAGDIAKYSGNLYVCIATATGRLPTDVAYWIPLGGSGGTGAVPLGAIVPWLPGYFTGAGNVGFTAVAVAIPAGYKECNGGALSAADSPVFGGTGRYLPDLDDGRYLAGNTAANAGTPTAAASTGVLTSSEIPQHRHTIDHDHAAVASGAPSNDTSGTPSAASTGLQSASHTHSTSIGSHGHVTSTLYRGIGSGAGRISGYGTGAITNPAETGAIASYDHGSKTSGGPSADHSHSMQSHTHSLSAHTHSVDIPNLTGVTSGYYGTASPSAINPRYINVRFLIRVR